MGDAIHYRSGCPASACIQLIPIKKPPQGGFFYICRTWLLDLDLSTQLDDPVNWQVEEAQAAAGILHKEGK